jgi:CRISPR system Cascade subunit CasD
MPLTLALCLDAPMQSWGTRSRGIRRDTATEPTKSGIIGMLAAAWGKERDDTTTITTLAALRLGIRVDREGIVERDYHTTQNVPTTLGTGHRTVVSERYYLADALFLIALSGDPTLLTTLHDALHRPRWPLFFGRRAFVPARPMLTSGQPDEPLTGYGLMDSTMEEVLETHPWLDLGPRARTVELAKTDPADRTPLRTVIDCPANHPEAQVRQDVPLSFAQHDRRFHTRTVREGYIPLTTELIHKGDARCS